MNKRSLWIGLVLLAIGHFVIPAIQRHMNEEEAQQQLANRHITECTSVEKIEAGCAEDDQ